MYQVNFILGGNGVYNPVNYCEFFPASSIASAVSAFFERYPGGIVIGYPQAV